MQKLILNPKMSTWVILVSKKNYLINLNTVKIVTRSMYILI